ncbi:MAG: alpha-glucuronidase [Bacteroidota bacterium]|nr:alpha-glucuronidase [Bacteroidota bacterium]MDP4217909.1 alpha-glucuronidase [Bacteroidota bacterium]MDP4253878.1 alpha-glucuronidase [Bacteroidota bacterium]
MRSIIFPLYRLLALPARLLALPARLLALPTRLLALPAILLAFPVAARAQEGQDLWLRDATPSPVNIICSRTSPTLTIARQELQQGWHGKPNASLSLTITKNKEIGAEGYRLDPDAIEAVSDIGILYGVYELLRRQRTGRPITREICNPSYERRILDHWDNLNGSVERGYAGHSIFWRKTDSFLVTEGDKARWQAYARANASVGINGAVLDNVNASPAILSAGYLQRVKAIADVLRPYGVRTYLSPNFASSKVIGGLQTADPLDPAVVKWWKEKVKEIYGLIPDFGGFLVKANSEGQPGPQDYGRTHADGANMFAAALKPFGGIVMWRAFVYSANDKDRAKQAYEEFVPLDGKFMDNVIIQVKNGPIDFQPREPFSPLFGAMKKTPVMPEFQITQEYLGHAVHLVFLSTMWEECLQSDTYQEGEGSTVARCTDGSLFPQKHTAIAGVSNIGTDSNWCGNDFAQANWYAFGRLAWNDHLQSDQIAAEWIRQTFPPPATGSASQPTTGSASPLIDPTDWEVNFLAPVKRMMLDSREAAVNYMMPLGFHHIMSANGHYGPGPWWAPKNVRPDWTPPYYHQADTHGVGFDRTRKGSDATGQYHEPLASLLDDPATCPEIYLLWFHHLPWDYRMKSGRTLWEEIAWRYDRGVQQVREFQKVWDRVEPYVDSARFHAVQGNLRRQAANAVLWKDACLLYFQQFSRMPIPYEIERPVNNLDEIIANDMRRRSN